jgi:hypothetical protein
MSPHVHADVACIVPLVAGGGASTCRPFTCLGVSVRDAVLYEALAAEGYLEYVQVISYCGTSGCLLVCFPSSSAQKVRVVEEREAPLIV